MFFSFLILGVLRILWTPITEQRTANNQPQAPVIPWNQIQPTVTPPIITEPLMKPQRGALDVYQNRSGYITPGTINGVPVPLMVDTGASMLSLTPTQANQSGITCNSQLEFMSAIGKTVGCIGIAKSVIIGPFHLTDVTVAVLPPGAEMALLGMNVLHRFHMVWHGDVVRITAGSMEDQNPPTPALVIPVPLLRTGASQRFNQDPDGTLYAPLKLIGNTKGKHCLVYLENSQTHRPVLSVFVRSAEVTELNVPLGQYRTKILCGEIWQGPKILFGPSYSPTELPNPLKFYRNENGGLIGMIISLT